MSDSNRVQVSYVAESTFGTTPSSALTIVRTTGESIKADTTVTKSREIRSDRQITDVVRTQAMGSGSLGIEMSYAAHDDLLAALLCSAGWSSPVTVTATTISAAASDNSFNSSASGFGSFAVGQWVKVGGFATAANNGWFKILTKTTAKITVNGGTLVNESATPSVTIKMGAQILNGTTLTSFSIEKLFSDLTNIFEVTRGAVINQGSISTAADALMTGSFDLMSKLPASATATIGTSYTAAPTNSIMSGVESLTGVLEGQASISINSMSFQVNNNMGGRLICGALGPQSFRMGSINATGTVVMYFETSAVMNKYLAFTSTSLAFIVVDGAGNSYVVDFPKIKFTSGQRVAGGQNQDIMASMAFEAFREPTESVTIRIARF